MCVAPLKGFRVAPGEELQLDLYGGLRSVWNEVAGQPKAAGSDLASGELRTAPARSFRQQNLFAVFVRLSLKGILLC